MLLMHLCTLVFQILTLPLQIAELVGLYSLYKRVFPFLVYKITFNYNRIMNEHKRELFRALDKFRPSNGTLRILEIGCGTGANFEHYPTGCKVICTDPNPHFENYLQKNMVKNDHLVYDKFVVATGEDLHAVPDDSVDVAVVTLVLCSVRDTGRVLKEAKRVLRPVPFHRCRKSSTLIINTDCMLLDYYTCGKGPDESHEYWQGGAFFFMEHVAADRSSWTYFGQHVLQPLWYYFGDGCETTRPTWEHIENAGFSQVNLRHIQAPITFVIKPHIVGYAVK